MIAVDERALEGYLRTRRWFGEKGGAVRSIRLLDRVPVRWPGTDREFEVARVGVETDAGTSTYQLFLAGNGKVPGDALEDAAFLRGLVDAFRSGASCEARGTRWIVESVARAPLVAPADADIRLARAEQSNSSVIVGSQAILKLFRKLEAGIHPDVEVTRFLTIERRFVHVPALLGVIRFEDARGETIAGMLQELVPGATDGWSHMLAVLREHRDPACFTTDAEQLGAMTRALHETLASGDTGTAFASRRAGANDLTRWTTSGAHMVARACATLRRALREGSVPTEQREVAERVLDRRDHHLQWLTDLSSRLTADAGVVARTHGDYHLGQVLRSGTGQYLVIDFEGEPARPLAERRSSTSPLRDVAGMLRSFEYGAAVSGAVSAAGATREAFLRGYFTHAQRQDLVPRATQAQRQLLALFELEKVYYELQYELDHRPDWVWVPLQGIAALDA